MTSNRQVAGQGCASKASKHLSCIALKLSRSLLKAAVVSLAVRGLCPYTAAQWLIHRGGLRNA